jgi:hypothetical protein
MLTNSGSIRSTVPPRRRQRYQRPTIANSGSVQNFGVGLALSGQHITSPTAARPDPHGREHCISAGEFLNLVNSGRIDGDVVVSASQGFASGSIVDSTSGIIMAA